MSELLRSRVRERLDKLGINPFEAERRAGLRRGYVNDLLIGKKETFREKAIPSLAEALECDADFLLGRQSFPTFDASDPSAGAGMLLSGIVEAGVWRDGSALSLPDTVFPIQPDPRFDRSKVLIYLVRGDHAAALGILDGSIVSIYTGLESYRDGDVVLARRDASDGSFELSIRVKSSGSYIARPAKGEIASISGDGIQVCGIVVSAVRVFGLPN